MSATCLDARYLQYAGIVTGDVVEHWLSADRAWTNRYAAVIEDAFLWFSEHHEWPEVRRLQRRYVQAGRRLDVQAIVDEKPAVPGQPRLLHEQHVVVGARHLLDCAAAQPMLSLLVAITDLAVKAYSTPGDDEPLLKSSDPEIACLADPSLVAVFPTFMFSDYPNAFSGGGHGGDAPWQLIVRESLIMDFAGVRDPQDYVRRQEEIIRRSVRENAAFFAAAESETAYSESEFGDDDPLVRFVGERGHAWSYDPGAPIGDPGGMGQVFGGADTDGGRVAVKRVQLVLDSESARRRREREVDIAKRLRAINSRHVMPVLDVGRVGDDLLLVMPLAERSLAAACRVADLDQPAKIEAIRQVALGLQELATVSVLHRDLKPANVLELDGRWHLADFGIARDLLESTGTFTLARFGSCPYMAPELWRGEPATVKSDLYALGVTAYELLAGYRPFQGPDENDYRDQHLNASPLPIEGVSPGVARLVLRLLAKDPNERPQDGRAVLERLDAALLPVRGDQERLREAAHAAERRRLEREASKAQLAAAAEKVLSDGTQAVADLRQILEDAVAMALEALGGDVIVRDDRRRWDLSLGAAQITLSLWDTLPTSDAGIDPLVQAGVVYSSALPRLGRSEGIAANVACERQNERLSWSLFRFQANSFVAPNYRLGPVDRLHGFGEATFREQRVYMLNPCMHIWGLQKTPLDGASLLGLFVEAIEAS